MTKIAKSLASKYQNDHRKMDRDGPKMDRIKLTCLSPSVHQEAQFRYHKTNRFLNNGKNSSRPKNEFTFNRIINIAIRIIKSEKFFYQHVITIFIFTFPIQNITTLIHHNISSVCLLSFQNFFHSTWGSIETTTIAKTHPTLE